MCRGPSICEGCPVDGHTDNIPYEPGFVYGFAELNYCLFGESYERLSRLPLIYTVAHIPHDVYFSNRCQVSVLHLYSLRHRSPHDRKIWSVFAECQASRRPSLTQPLTLLQTQVCWRRASTCVLSRTVAGELSSSVSRIVQEPTDSGTTQSPRITPTTQQGVKTRSSADRHDPLERGILALKP